MEISKSIEYALKQRCKLAIRLIDYCAIIDKFIDENNIDCDSEDYHGGVEIYVNPIDSYERILEAIKNK